MAYDQERYEEIKNMEFGVTKNETRLVFVLAAGFIITAGLLATALAHDAPVGWSYDASCCNTIDCRQITGSASKSQVKIAEVTGGYNIYKPGVKEPEFIKWNAPNIRQSKDGEYHWCSAGGKDYGRTICLYIPDRGY